MVSLINIQQFVCKLVFMKFSFIHLIRLHVDNVRVYKRVFMKLSMTVGQSALPDKMCTFNSLMQQNACYRNVT